MNVRVLQVIGQAARGAPPAGSIRPGFALQEGREPQREPLFADSRRPPKEQRLGDPAGISRPAQPILELGVTDDRMKAHDRPRSQRTGSTCRGFPSRPGS